MGHHRLDELLLTNPRKILLHTETILRFYRALNLTEPWKMD